MSKIALGTVQFGTDYGINSTHGNVQLDEVERILNYAKSEGIELLDTAPAYGNSEQILGDCNVHKFNVVTKTRHFDCSIISNREVDLLVSDFKISLKLLKQKSIYGVLIHNADDLLKSKSDKLYNCLNDFKHARKVKKIGVSIYNHEQLQSIVNNFDIDLVQLPFNILDRRLINSGIFKILQDNNVEVHARSVFLQGLLLMTEQSRPKKFNYWESLWKVWHEWLNDNHITALEATIRYAISTTEISKVLVGVDSTKQLKEIISASYGDLPDMPDELFISDVNLLNPSNWAKI
jgi:aryl-alcohol dehydrogenase-like predicted oxidoreductase